MDWTLANQIQYSDHNNEIPFVTSIRLPNFPVDDFILPGVGFAAANHHKFFVPLHGNITKFDVKKLFQKTMSLKLNQNKLVLVLQSLK